MIVGTERVGELAREIPHACRVFERHKIDYCCGGKRTLTEACERVGAPLDAVVAALSEPARDAGRERVWTSEPIDALVAHIVGTHHAYLAEELPRISALADKVAKVHGGEHPYLLRVREVFEAIRADLEPHMMKEERVLFPYLLRLGSSARGGARPTAPPFGSAANPIRCMDEEHESVGDALEELRARTSGYAPPPHACGSWRALYAALSELELDLHQHIHLESNVLFPRALVLEEELLPRRAG